MVPKAVLGIWFHDLPALATLRGIVVAVEAGATRGGMAVAGVAQNWPATYQAQVTSAVGTSQEEKPMIRPSYVRRLAQQPGVYSLVPDSEAAVEPSARTMRRATAEMVYATSTRPSYGGSTSLWSPPSMLEPRRCTESQSSTSL